MIACSFGLGKTHQQIEILRIIQAYEGGKVLIICPLGVKHQFTEEDGPRLGVKIQYVRNNEEAESAETPFHITNYERVRDGNLDITGYLAVSLDEGSVLRSFGTKTTQEFIDLFQNTKYKFVCTATPSPNRYKEILHYAHWLGVMDAGQALTRWFKRDSQKAGNLTIHPQHEKDFWLWVSSWALFLTKPSDLGYSDEGYDLPPLDVIWHLVKDPQGGLHVDNWGQSAMFHTAGGNLQAASKEKRRTLSERIVKMAEIVNSSDPDKHWLLWHHLEDEREAIVKALPGTKDVYGSQDLELREQLILDFSHGKYQRLATKPEIAGSGCNFQRYCHSNIFVGINYKFQDFIQAMHRTHRFQQKNQVEVHIIYTDAEEPIRKELEAKWQRHSELMVKMREIITEFGLNQTKQIEQLKRNMGVTRRIEKGNNYIAVHNDCVQEMQHIESNSVGLIHTSIPFGNHYEYSANYNDFGHNEDNPAFFKQLDFLTPELLRVLQPGRLAVVHVKDRVQYGNVTGMGMSTIEPFHADCIYHYRQHGFAYMGMITIETDVVRENNQTYRLGWSEQCKDGSKMGVGCPEYLLLFRKLPTDLSNAYADLPVIKSKEEYSRGRWQVDARAKWNSSGDRLLLPEEVAKLPIDKLNKQFSDRMRNLVYDFNNHMEVVSKLEEIGKLPSTFETTKIPARTDQVWSDINRMRTLNSNQTQRKEQNHICPLQLDIVERVITRWSNPGDLVLDPFGGLMSVPYSALKLGRKGYGVELNAEYFRCGVQYLREMEYKQSVPTLFDMVNL